MGTHMTDADSLRRARQRQRSIRLSSMDRQRQAPPSMPKLHKFNYVE